MPTPTLIDDGYAVLESLIDPSSLATLHALAVSIGHTRSLTVSERAPIAERVDVGLALLDATTGAFDVGAGIKADSAVADRAPDDPLENLGAQLWARFASGEFDGADAILGYWAVDDWTEADGAIQIVPGSHATPLPSDEWKVAGLLPGAVTIAMPAGAVLLMAPNIIHRHASVTSGTRRTLTVEWIGTYRGAFAAKIQRSGWR